MSATGIDKAQFGTCYARVRAQVLTTSAARKAFQDCGMTTDSNSSKVLDRIAAPSTSASKPQRPPLAEQTNIATPWPSAELNNLLDNYRNEEDPRSARSIKHTLLQAYSSVQAGTDMMQAENMVLLAQEERNRAVVMKKVPKAADGDRMYLSKERMITREQAEKELVANAPVIAKHALQKRRRVQRRAAAHDKDNDADDAEVDPSLETVEGIISQLT